MSNEEDFTGKFLTNLDRLTDFFRSGAINVKKNLGLEGLLKDIIGREKPLRMLQNLAVSHYLNDPIINKGFNIMLEQISYYKKQLTELNEESNKNSNIYFNSGIFANGYFMVENRLKELLAKSI